MLFEATPPKSRYHAFPPPFVPWGLHRGITGPLFPLFLLSVRLFPSSPSGDRALLLRAFPRPGVPNRRPVCFCGWVFFFWLLARLGWVLFFCFSLFVVFSSPFFFWLVVFFRLLVFFCGVSVSFSGWGVGVFLLGFFVLVFFFLFFFVCLYFCVCLAFLKENRLRVAPASWISLSSFFSILCFF